MPWFDCAVRRPISGGTSGPMRAHRGLVLHHAVSDAASLYDVFNNGEVSTTFFVSKSGVIEQYLDSSLSQWATGSSVGNFEYNSVETQGCAAPPHAEPMTEPMVAALARLYAEGNRRHGWPFQLANAPGANGFAYHRAFSATACPCDVRLSMRPEILRRAQGAPGPEPPKPLPPKTKVTRGKDGDDVTSLQDDTFNHVWGEVDGKPCHWWQFLPGKGDNPKAGWFFEWLPTS